MSHKRKRQKAWKVLTAFCPRCGVRLPERPLDYVTSPRCGSCGWPDRLDALVFALSEFAQDGRDDV